MSILLALMGSPALAGSGDFDLGLYSGVVVPGSQHELYAPTHARHKQLSPGPALGGRVAWYPASFIGLEGETWASTASVQDAERALLYATRGQVQFLAPLALPGDLEPFLVAGVGNIGVNSTADALGSDLDYAIHTGIGTLIPVSERVGLRVDARYLFADRNISLNTPGGHTEVLVGMNYRIPRAEEEKEVVPLPDVIGAVEVRVHDDDGIAMADVQILVDGREVGRTDSDGRITIDDLSGMVEITAHHFHIAEDVTQTVEVVEGAVTATLTTSWLPGRVRVVTRSNEGPILDAAVSFIGPKEMPASLVDNGNQLFFLSPGEWSIIIAASTMGTERRDLAISSQEDSLVVIEVQLEPAKVEVTREEMVILEKIQFEVGSAGIDSGSLGLIQELANNIVVHGGIQKLEIQGYTDSIGSSASNKKLSQERVESVRDALVKRGVDPGILEAVGYGEDISIASNDTEEGRTKNRRVQFLILEQE